MARNWIGYDKVSRTGLSAEDVAHNLLLKIRRELMVGGQIDPHPGAESSYMARGVRNALVDDSRKIALLAVDDFEATLTAGGQSAEEQVYLKGLNRALRRALSLCADARVVESFYLDKNTETLEAYAERVGLAISNLKILRKRLLEKIRANDKIMTVLAPYEPPVKTK
jgi:hypothetical protein